jgi:hypothetical protein
VNTSDLGWCLVGVALRPRPAIRSVSARTAMDGSFTFSDLPAGEDFIAALSDLDPLVTLVEGEEKRQDLRVK